MVHPTEIMKTLALRMFVSLFCPKVYTSVMCLSFFVCVETTLLNLMLSNDLLIKGWDLSLYCKPVFKKKKKLRQRF